MGTENTKKAKEEQEMARQAKLAEKQDQNADGFSEFLHHFAFYWKNHRKSLWNQWKLYHCRQIPKNSNSEAVWFYRFRRNR